MHDELAWSLMQLWVLWYSSAAAFGAFFGTLAALAVFYGVRNLYRKHKARKARR
jgi:hypothetical protein